MMSESKFQSIQRSEYLNLGYLSIPGRTLEFQKFERPSFSIRITASLVEANCFLINGVSKAKDNSRIVMFVLKEITVKTGFVMWKPAFDDRYYFHVKEAFGLFFKKLFRVYQLHVARVYQLFPPERLMRIPFTSWMAIQFSNNGHLKFEEQELVRFEKALSTYLSLFYACVVVACMENGVYSKEFPFTLRPNYGFKTYLMADHHRLQIRSVSKEIIDGALADVKQSVDPSMTMPRTIISMNPETQMFLFGKKIFFPLKCDDCETDIEAVPSFLRSCVPSDDLLCESKRDSKAMTMSVAKRMKMN